MTKPYGKAGTDGPSRRAFILGVGSYLPGLASNVPGAELVRAWDHLLNRDAPVLPDPT